MPVRAQMPPMAGAVSQAPQHGGYASVAVDESSSGGVGPRKLSKELGDVAGVHGEPEPEPEPEPELAPETSEDEEEFSEEEEEDDDEEEFGGTPWTEMIISALFIGIMLGFQNLHFDISAQHDVHASLRAALQLRIDSTRGDAGAKDWASITSTVDMFAWLQDDLLPAVTVPESGCRLPPASLSAEECRAALPSDAAAAVDDSVCQSCSPVAGMDGLRNSTDELTFVNEYALLYKGILIRQKRHCQIASINADGELHRITYREHQGQQQGSSCISNEMFDETDEDIEYFSSGGGGGERDVLPAFECYRFDRTSIAAAGNLSAREATWAQRARIGKDAIFIPTQTGNAAALTAARALLTAASAAQWADPATAAVDVSFIVMSIQYGVVTEVKLTCDYHLGGHIVTGFRMRSISASMLDGWSGWSHWLLRWEPWGDSAFCLLLFWRWWLEIKIMVNAATYQKRQRGQLREEEFRLFYANLTRKSYLGSKWTCLKLVAILCHTGCCYLLIQTKIARWTDGAFSELVHAHHHAQGDARWSFDDETWSGYQFDGESQDPAAALSEISAIGDTCDRLRYLSSVMLVLQAVLCLQYFVHIDPRLAIITESIRVVSDELTHFGFVFLFTLGMYAMAGHTMYGAELSEFRDLTNSAQACFALMLGGDNFGRMDAVTHKGTLVFYWSWVFLGLLILMNLILSILIEGHLEARELIYEHEEQDAIYQRVWQKVPSPVKATVSKLQETFSPSPRQDDDATGAAGTTTAAESTPNQARRGSSRSGGSSSSTRSPHTPGERGSGGGSMRKARRSKRKAGTGTDSFVVQQRQRQSGGTGTGAASQSEVEELRQQVEKLSTMLERVLAAVESER